MDFYSSARAANRLTKISEIQVNIMVEQKQSMKSQADISAKQAVLTEMSILRLLRTMPPFLDSSSYPNGRVAEDHH